MRGLHAGCRLKFHYIVSCRLKFSTFVVVGKSQLIFLSLIGNYFPRFAGSQ